MLWVIAIKYSLSPYTTIHTILWCIWILTAAESFQGIFKNEKITKEKNINKAFVIQSNDVNKF